MTTHSYSKAIAHYDTWLTMTLCLRHGASNISRCPYLCMGQPNNEHVCLCPDNMKVRLYRGVVCLVLFDCVRCVCIFRCVVCVYV